ncbi:lipoyl(octanoyl) transferase LipB [Gynuella sunshinyii]|uniref:Octanoyltransferase n=1 Tax=Gynuella sunshinyii YC6258 TaxID=1445510 RepID=A0A0C5VVM3_9GAMM|nr:lipoyl(octanoyl) transferase LipB [Gynuella sunshinyii]AJQ94519.1 lipoate-protein ligase B [Gynuella sunshinyii YC6258]
MSENRMIVRDLGMVEYLPTWKAMQDFTSTRDETTEDEIWLLEHYPVFTQGQAGKAEHLLNPGDIPVVQADRGGQVTYHGPGQLVAYILMDIRRSRIGVRNLVSAIEQSVIDTLALYGISSAAKPDAPGVYVEGAKIASLGLRVKKGCSFHGLGFNLDMDLEPFQRINPCGYSGMNMTQLQDYVERVDISQVKSQWVRAFANCLGLAERLIFTDMVEELVND